MHVYYIKSHVWRVFSQIGSQVWKKMDLDYSLKGIHTNLGKKNLLCSGATKNEYISKTIKSKIFTIPILYTKLGYHVLQLNFQVDPVIPVLITERLKSTCRLFKHSHVTQCWTSIIAVKHIVYQLMLLVRLHCKLRYPLTF